ncbi:MAG TPA: NAD(P)/FAD-dependent oxidoreductase [Labilithrix sp.]|nr:NAD(P)/FAD-dependent oxidoreductase [Labilithrix sp.]
MCSPIRSHYDVVVVGARCAGSATAMLLARRGLRVLAVDRSSYGSDALSTHALMRGGVLQLRRWGLLDRIASADTPPIRTTSFFYGDRELAVPIRDRYGVGALYAPRRTLLDRVLVDAAREAGADVRHHVDVVDVRRSRPVLSASVQLVRREGKLLEVGANVVVGADGFRSKVAEHVGARPHRSGHHATAIVFGYWSGLMSTGYRWYYRPGVAAGVIPTNHSEACVFVAVPPERLLGWARGDLAAGFSNAVHSVNADLAQSLTVARRSGALRSLAGSPGFLRKACGNGWALVGDAGYFKDAITAHGMTDALRDAELLSRAIACGTDRALADYQETRDALSVEMLEASDAIASFAWDLDALEKHHETMNTAMKREVQALEFLDLAEKIAV